MSNKELNYTNSSGFTLVELAIVLVIIGLLVGGVLQGQELIKQAQIRKQLQGFKDIQLAYSTFQTKYSAVPGDMKNATRFFPTCDRSIYGDPGTVYEGNGDGIISVAANEDWCVMLHLKNAGMYDPQIMRASYFSANNPPTAVDYSTGGQRFFIWPINSKPQIIAQIGDREVFYDGRTGNNLMSMQTSSDTGASMSAEMTKGLDEKMDDGRPFTGTLRAKTTDDLSEDMKCFSDSNIDMSVMSSVYRTSEHLSCFTIYFFM